MHLEENIQDIFMKSRLLEIATCYNIQATFQKLNETLKHFRQYLNVKKYTEKLI